MPDISPVKHPWRVLRDGLPTGQYFSNAHAAAKSALLIGKRAGRGMDHPLFGAFDALGCMNWVRNPTTEMPKELPPRKRRKAHRPKPLTTNLSKPQKLHPAGQHKNADG